MSADSPTNAGGAYEAVLIAGLREHVFDLEDYDAEAATREAAGDISQLGKFAQGLRAADVQIRKGSGS